MNSSCREARVIVNVWEGEDGEMGERDVCQNSTLSDFPAIEIACGESEKGSVWEDMKV